MALKAKLKGTDFLYRSLFENTLDGLAYCRMVFDAQGHPVDFIYLKVNKNFKTMTGLGNPIGKKVTELIPGIYASNPELFRIYGEVAFTGKSKQFQTYIKPLSRWFFVSAYSPKKNFFVALFQNITSHRQIGKNLEDARIAAQNVIEDLSDEKSKYEVLAKELEKFKLALDGASDNIIITDPKGIVVYVNKAVETVTGYKPEEVIGKKSDALWKTPITLEYYKELWDTINQKKPFTGEIQNIRKNGLVYTASIGISPILDKKGEVEFFVAVERDVTKEREVERSKSEFVSLASHQLRTPPSIIGWYTETLLSGDIGPVTKKQAEYLDEIYRANQRMIAVIGSLLNISRIEMGTFVISAKSIDMRALIDEVIKELILRFNRNVEFIKDYDPAVSLFNGDPNIMGIIVDNLISNAIKYSQPDNAPIKITMKKEGDSLSLSVKNSGIGIPAKDQSRIFEKLFRADNAVATNPDGTGLGLYMLKKIIVDGLGGKIWFDSTADKETTFYVSLPASGMKEKPGTTALVRVKSI